jgi:hypothetical protein
MTLLGVSASNNSGAVVNRSCGSGYIISCVEAQVTTDSGSAFTFGADRRHYDDITNSWPPNADNVFGRLSGHATADWEMGRLPVMSSKYAGATWAQVASAASGTIYNNIVTRGNVIKAWQDAHIGLGVWGCTFAWTFHHEPNNDSGGAGMAVTDWQNAIQNIVTIWQGLGVRFWTGENDGTTTSEGIILSINLITGETSGGYQNDWPTWWPTNHTWMNANMVCAAGDGYNNGDVFKPLSYMFQTFKSWTDAKRTSQASAGKPFLAAIWETGCQADSFYTSSHSTWTATGLSRTKTNWFANMASYIQSSWPLLHHLCYWDSVVTMIWTLDTTQTDWNGFVAISHHAAFVEAGLTTLPAGTTTYTSHTTVAEGDTLRFPPNASATLIMDNKNLIIEGRLEMKPQSASVVHLLQFTNVNEQIFVGGSVGGMGTPLTTDIGLWVMNNGILDAIGTEKAGWNRTGDDPTWLSTDGIYATPWAFGDRFSLAFTKGTAPATVTAPNGVVCTQEVFNLTRNVRIEGTPGHNTHVFIRTDVAQTIKYAQLRYVGPRHLTGDSDVSVVLRGRWGMHLHHVMEEGSLIEGCIVRDNPSHAFVAHGSDGVTFRDCIAFNFNEDAYWWDEEVLDDISLDVTYDHCMACYADPIPLFKGYQLSGFNLTHGSGTVNDCVAVAIGGSADSSGYKWPEIAAIAALGGQHGLWAFTGNVAHNNNRYGLFFWENDGQSHHVQYFTAFRNGSTGLTAGAYLNRVRYDHLLLFSNGSGTSEDADIRSVANSLATSPNELRFDDSYAQTMVVRESELAIPTPARVMNSTVGHVTVHEYPLSGTNESGPGHFFDFINTNLEPANWTVDFMDAQSIFRVQRADGTAYQVLPNGTKPVISAFFHYITTVSLTTASQGVAFSQTLASTLKTGAVTWALRSGSAALPPGLSLSSAGVISGTPTTLGTYPVTIQATDAVGAIAVRAFSQVVAGAVALQITTSSLPGGVVGTSYSATLAAIGGTPAYTWSLASGTLPTGVGLSLAGVLSGTPTTVASYSFTIRVTDATAATATRAFSVAVVNLNPTITTTSPLPTGQVGVAYSRTLNATGGTPAYTWSIVSGSLPAGLSLAPSTGVISGTPTLATTNTIVFRVTDSAARTDDETLALSVTAGVSFLSSNPPPGRVGAPYSYTFTGQGGTSPYSFNVANSSLLPPGLTLASSGLLSGIPTISGTFAFAVTISDAGSLFASAQVSINVGQDVRKPRRALQLRGRSRYTSVH